MSSYLYSIFLAYLQTENRMLFCLYDWFCLIYITYRYVDITSCLYVRIKLTVLCVLYVKIYSCSKEQPNSTDCSDATGGYKLW